MLYIIFMKHLLQKILLNTLAIVAVSYIAPGLTYGQSLGTLLLAALVLAIINAFLRPILKILLLPINIITLGLMGWLVNVIILYLVTLLVPGFEVVPFTLSIGGSTIVLSTFWAFVVISFLLNIATTLISWIIVS